VWKRPCFPSLDCWLGFAGSPSFVRISFRTSRSTTLRGLSSALKPVDMRRSVVSFALAVKVRSKRTGRNSRAQLHQASNGYAAALHANLALAARPMTGRSRADRGLSAQTRRGCSIVVHKSDLATDRGSLVERRYQKLVEQIGSPCRTMSDSSAADRRWPGHTGAARLSADRQVQRSHPRTISSHKLPDTASISAIPRWPTGVEAHVGGSSAARCAKNVFCL
jgi:hypothetical protein